MGPWGVIMGAALLLSTSGTSARGGPPGVESVTTKASPPPATESRAPLDIELPYERYQLDNGLEVILHQDRRVPLVAVNIWYHVGSGDEQPGRSGFAHLFEHMMFQGSKHVGADRHFDLLREVGATDINGTTNRDRTNYFETVPAHQLETALWMESDRMGFMLELLTEESLANQRDVVRNERRQRYDNVPYGRERFAVAAALYPEGHPYRYLTIGRHEELEAASLAEIKAFFRRWYTPSNATLALAGDFELERAKALIDKWFGGFPRLERAARQRVAPPPLQATTRGELPDAFARLERVHYAWHAPPALAEGALELRVIAEILGDAGWGRLHHRLVDEERLARRVSVYHDAAQYAGSFDLVVTLTPGAARARVEEVIAEELARLIAEPPSEDELRRVVLATESAFVWSLERLGGRVNRLQWYNHYTGDPGYAKTELERLRAVTPASVRAGPRAEIITTPGGGR